ncbi:MAG: rubrerythrin family protein [Calditrichaeota bacterium]|nr:MAG: rubrerythrin family protein [Calditrichota bacterium]
MDKKTRAILLNMQKNEITEYNVYQKLTRLTKDEHNKGILQKIAQDEYEHFKLLEKITGESVKPSRLKIYWYTIIAHLLGLSFGLKLMERGEELANKAYATLSGEYDQLEQLALDEHRHEKELLGILQEERLEYAGAMVLGLNDALVELTGALAGLTFALQNSQLVALTGLLTGFAASLSMAASGYLSSKENAPEEGGEEPLKSALYTGFAYIITVALLIAPYFIFANIFLSFAVMLATGILIIFAYTFYITTAKSLNFWRRFLEMVVISVSVAVLSFLAGLLIKNFIDVDI